MRYKKFFNKMLVHFLFQVLKCAEINDSSEEYNDNLVLIGKNKIQLKNETVINNLCQLRVYTCPVVFSGFSKSNELTSLLEENKKCLYWTLFNQHRKLFDFSLIKHSLYSFEKSSLTFVFKEPVSIDPIKNIAIYLCNEKYLILNIEDNKITKVYEISQNARRCLIL